MAGLSHTDTGYAQDRHIAGKFTCSNYTRAVAHTSQPFYAPLSTGTLPDLSREVGSEASDSKCKKLNRLKCYGVAIPF